MHIALASIHITLVSHGIHGHASSLRRCDGGGVDCARISRILLCTFQAIFSVKLQVILKMACGEAKIQKFSKIFCVLTIYIVEMYKKVCKVIRRKSEIRAQSTIQA